MTTLTLFVLCHNRPDFARQTMLSILKQSDRDFELIVSDNSSSDEVECMMRVEFPQIEYRRRVPMLAANAHFNRCIDEVRGDYFCLFHDDDLMHPDYIRQMRTVLDAHPALVACSCNARLETMGRMESRTSFRALGKLETIQSARDLARRYFSRAQSGIAPFPGYIYRRSAVGDLRLDVDGGKYTDVTWLLNLTMRRPMVWLNEPLMTYRIHGGNDGKVESPRDRLRFLRYVKRHTQTLGKDLLADYRCSFIYKPMLKDGTVSALRLGVAKRFVKHYSWSRYTNPSYYAALFKRALVKRMAA
jgi:glycosyltransferase involved in cell wall biosynthesis